MRKTLRAHFSVKGTGIHTGVYAEVEVLPSFSEKGIYFSYQNAASGEQGYIPCHVANVVSTRRCTVLGNGEHTVSTVEHLLATLHANGITDAELKIDGPEVPILDGSGAEIQKKIDEAGIEEYEGDDWSVLVIDEPLEFTCHTSGAEYHLTPSEAYELEAVLEYDNALLGGMKADWQYGDDYAEKIAPARTFSLYSEVAGLLKGGMIQGGSLKNALVVLDDDLTEEDVKSDLNKYISGGSDVSIRNHVINGPMFFENEPARHKILDLLGDLSLLNLRIQGRVSATRPGHTGNYNLARYLINAFYG
ncbi:UDP-3-O-acyl-N-acetylglucosamine deacetylase [Membranicola marinus]|uniref:UDP-3-O-acyl-N-acetylglucosamine deacetylase n=1 Tax=Membranihabitans marinus TaxID=1227546 RepID=A0A953L9Q3_9BACT|nr:UDP-3-O-acyl-N-acetylglucosamine deacetylase [Membranihabitans marinus]MBY5957868.1 UDP-3-O-acyl-N-acetylglucosamine deacetylase [Membranihabitans marinus]